MRREKAFHLSKHKQYRSRQIAGTVPPMVERPTILINHLMEPPNQITGITRFLFSLLDQLVRLPQFKYVLATTWDADQLPPKLANSGLHVVTRPFHRSLPHNMMMQMVQLPHLMQQFSAVAEFNCNPVGCFWPHWSRIITVHDLYFDVTPQYYRWRHRLWWRVFFPLALRAARTVLCVSASTREDLRHYYPRQVGKSVVVHEANTLQIPDKMANDSPLEDNEQYAIIVGNVSPNKNPGCLTSALKILENRGQPLTVFHVGRDDAGLLAQSARYACLRHPIQNLGRLSDEALVAAYARAMFMVSASTHEGFCLPILEAQGCGTPVICSDIPVLREVAGEAAIFFDPAKPEMLADCIDRLRIQKQLHRKLSETGLRNAARFSWARAAAETEALLKSAIGSQ
jgi:glycosyltransferase involved in cell wall biosynthesis